MLFLKKELRSRKQRTFLGFQDFTNKILNPLNQISSEFGLRSTFAYKITKASNMNLACSHCNTVVTFTLGANQRIDYNRFYHGLRNHCDVT